MGIQIDIFQNLSTSFHGRDEFRGIQGLTKPSAKRAFDYSFVIIDAFQSLRIQIIFILHNVIFYLRIGVILIQVKLSKEIWKVF